MSRMVFLKLGGSLITQKGIPSTPRPEVISRLAQEIHFARQQDPDLQLVLGHGSGSFGHSAASKSGTREGVSTPVGWQGFAEVWRQARALDTLVLEALHQTGEHAVAFPASAAALTENQLVRQWNLEPIERALTAGLLPVVYGDVVFDHTLGGTILSTEDIFAHLALYFNPQRILLAGLEPGVWKDYPRCEHLAEQITPDTFEEILPALSGSAAADVTGGMRSKVEEMLSLVKEIPGLEIFIFSGEEKGHVQAAILGKPPGTKLTG